MLGMSTSAQEAVAAEEQLLAFAEVDSGTVAAWTSIIHRKNHSSDGRRVWSLGGRTLLFADCSLALTIAASSCVGRLGYRVRFSRLAVAAMLGVTLAFADGARAHHVACAADVIVLLQRMLGLI